MSGQVALHLEPEMKLAVVPTGVGAGAAYVAPASPDDTRSSSSPSSSPKASGGGAKKSETDLPPAYLEYLASLQKAWGDLPDLTITYEQLCYEVSVPVSTQEIPNLWSFFRDGLKSLNVFRDKSKETRLFQPLHASTGVVRPGELTLILAPPGHGKSVLLKALAGRMVREATAIKGEVRWNGLTAAESKLHGQQLAKLTAFVEQGDVHFPMLTVRETFQFAADNSTADSALLGSPDFAARQDKKVELMLELLGLKECADTIVGNAMMRGVSGGQKKRVTLGEMMIGQARALFLDEVSTGLDSSATFDIISALKRWTRVMRGSATVALLQPAPEVYDLFDNIILLREGHIVFSGTKAQLDAHLKACNITPNPDVDFADWLVEFLTDPVAIWKRDVEARGRHPSMRSFRKSFREEHSGINPRANAGSGAHGMYGEDNALGFNRNNLSVPRSQNGTNDGSSTIKAQLVMPSAVTTSKAAHDDPAEVMFHVGSDDTDEPATVRADAPIKTAVAAGMPTVASSSSLASQAEGAQQPRRKGLGQVVSSENVPLSTASLRKRYQDSAVYKDLLTEISARRSLGAQTLAQDAQARSAFTHSQFYSPLSRGTWFHTRANLHRQALVMVRSLPTFVLPRIFQAIFMGLVMGSLFYGLGTEPKDFGPRLGVILFGCIFMGFGNMMEVPLASQFKMVVYKQVDAGMYSTLSYVFSVILMQLPLSLTEVFIFGTLLYFLAAFNWAAGTWFFFLLIMLMVNQSVGAIFRTIAYTVPNPDVAMNLAGPTTAIFLIFGGFLVTADKIPNFFIWLYYLSPFSWAVRSGALNEFHSSRYPRPIGDAYLDVWQVSNNDDYKWGGVGYLAGLFAFFVGVSAYVLISLRSWLTVGTRRDHNEGALSEADIDGAKADDTVHVRIGAKTTSMAAADDEARALEDANQLAFTRMDLSFSDLRYTVTVTEQDEDGKPRTYERALLQGINGYAKAGELTALMGSSGAGKTTLMDVIAGRKTSGKITGKILVNGHPQTFPTFNRLMGYCEQVDVHVGMHTVREAIDFSAKLRLPSDVTAEQRDRFVTQILADLELTSLANRIIGDANVEGLSPGELKRLTIGVELAANPTFLFLDEPTSGLDARAAMIVLRVIRKVAQRGRSIVCTIHQPSAELFGMFDRLLLLKSGGKESYFGPIGEEGVDVVSYFINADIDAKYFRPELPDKVNVASWMLDVIGAGTSAKGLIAPYDEVYKQSELRKRNMETVARLSTPEDHVKPASFDTVYASTASTQFRLVLHRLFTVYWRDTSYNSVKFFLMGFLGIIFGLVYLQINDDDEPGMISKISVIYMSFGFVGVLQASNALPVVFKLREVFYRERASNTFAPWIYSTTLGLVELPYLFTCAFLFTLPLYFLVGFENSGSLFFKFVLVLFLGAVFFCYMGQLFASLMPNIQVANMIQGLCFTFFFLFGGVFIQKGSMPIGWQWVYYIDPIPKGLISLSLQQFYCSDSRTDCPRLTSIRFGSVSKYDYVRNYLATGNGWEDYYLGWLLLEIVVIRILVAWIVQKVSHVKR